MASATMAPDATVEKVMRQVKPDVLRAKPAGEGAIAAPEIEQGSYFPEVDQDTYNAARAPRGGSGNAKIVDVAKQFLGTPYVWGGTSPLGFDCSGFTQYVYKQMGVNLPRISYQQGNGGTAVDKGSMQAGDLVFWDNSSRNNGADHVAIYIGNGQIIAAPKPGDRVKIQSLYGNYFVRRYL